jgi:HK97 family phage major capsid protein
MVIAGAPSLECIRHTGTAGSPAIVAEGTAKPEIVFTTDKVIATPKKIAAHTAITWESLSDWPTFDNYMRNELQRQVIDVENGEALDGDGTASHLSGLNTTAGILTHPVGTDTALDSIEIATVLLRTGPALANADLLILNPATWSALRREKDSTGRYLVDQDPTNAPGNKLWGLTVIVTTTQSAGVATLLDTTKFGFILVRESLVLRTGTSEDDFVTNVVRVICEERIEVAVERPPAICKVTGLPTAAASATTEGKRK